MLGDNKGLGDRRGQRNDLKVDPQPRQEPPLLQDPAQNSSSRDPKPKSTNED